MSIAFEGYPYINNMQTTVQALGLAVHEDKVFYVSTAGPGTSCKSVWSSLVAPKHKIDCRPWGYDLSGAGNLQTIYQSLPNSNYQHMVSMYRLPRFLIAVHPQGAVFYDDLEIDHVQERERLLQAHLPEVINRFTHYLSNHTNVPVISGWGAQLWQSGIADGGIAQLESYGDCIGAWLIDAEYDWLSTVQQLLALREIEFPAPVVQPSKESLPVEATPEITPAPTTSDQTSLFQH